MGSGGFAVATFEAALLQLLDTEPLAPKSEARPVRAVPAPTMQRASTFCLPQRTPTHVVTTLVQPASPVAPVFLSLPSFPVVAAPPTVNAIGYVTAPRSPMPRSTSKDISAIWAAPSGGAGGPLQPSNQNHGPPPGLQQAGQQMSGAAPRSKAVSLLTDHAEESNVFGQVFEAFAFAR
jgi:hypothetical protein